MCLVNEHRSNSTHKSLYAQFSATEIAPEAKEILGSTASLVCLLAVLARSGVLPRLPLQLGLARWVFRGWAWSVGVLRGYDRR